MIENAHDGKVNDSRFGVRMRGEGNIAEMVNQQYKKYGKIYGLNAEKWELDSSRFEDPGHRGVCFDIPAGDCSKIKVRSMKNSYICSSENH